MCHVIKCFEEPTTLGAADGEGGEGDWERAALASQCLSRQTMQNVPHPQQTKLFLFCDTSSIFLSWGEGASMVGERDEHKFQKPLCQFLPCVTRTRALP